MQFWTTFTELLNKKNWVGILVLCAVSSAITLYLAQQDESDGRLVDSKECQKMLARNDSIWLDREDRKDAKNRVREDSTAKEYAAKLEEKNQKLEDVLSRFYDQERNKAAVKSQSRREVKSIERTTKVIDSLLKP